MARDEADEKDQSMEEILQSIKRIIAEEGESETSATPQDEAAPDEDDGVLDLTETVANHPIPAVPAASSGSASAATPPMPIPSPQPDRQRDVLADIDSLLSEETVRTGSAALRALSEAQAPGRSARDVSRSEPAFRSGNTVEDLVLESLRPMLKEWLDANLADIVQDLVAKEIKKLSH